MAEKIGVERKPVRAIGNRKPAGRRPYSRRISPHFDARVRLDLYPGQRDGTTYVYAATDAKGAVKIGITNSPSSRLAVLHSTAKAKYRPLMLIGFIEGGGPGDALMIERIAHGLLSGYEAKRGTSKEWFLIDPEYAMRVIRRAKRLLRTVEKIWPRGLPVRYIVPWARSRR